MPATEHQLQCVPADIVRRYCECGPTSRPAAAQHTPHCRTCSLPRTRSGWSIASLTALRDQMREHLSLAVVVKMTGENMQRADIALNVLLGRTPVQALAVLERQAMRGFVMVRADDEDETRAVAS